MGELNHLGLVNCHVVHEFWNFAGCLANRDCVWMRGVANDVARRPAKLRGTFRDTN